MPIATPGPADRPQDKALFGFRSEPFVAFIEHRSAEQIYRLRCLTENGPIAATLRFSDTSNNPAATDEVIVPAELGYLTEGDIVRFNPYSGAARVLYRRNSQHNVLFFTERCNSRCLMCSQPPRDVDDSYLIDDMLRMIPWMAKETAELGITGGEPTLLGKRLLEVIASAKKHLPTTALHMLSNGRLFSYVRYAQQLADVSHPNLMIGVPVYADTSTAHDFVVQAKGAFEQTIFGLLNLARVGLRVELRMVIHQQTYSRLPEFAQFVTRNLPFVDQVVLMGLEMKGYTRSNLDALWVDPVDYQDHLEECVDILDDSRIAVHIYNHQLCLLKPSLRRFAKKSISDWKNIYMAACDGCLLKSECGGFFASGNLRHSPYIRRLG